MFCNTVYTFSQNQQEISAVSSVVNFKALLATAALQNSTFFVRHKKTEWYGDVHCKQCAVTELLVAQKGSLSNTDKWLKMYSQCC